MALRAAGRPVQEIAERIGHSRASTYRWLVRYGIPRRAVTLRRGARRTHGDRGPWLATRIFSPCGRTANPTSSTSRSTAEPARPRSASGSSPQVPFPYPNHGRATRQASRCLLRNRCADTRSPSCARHPECRVNPFPADPGDHRRQRTTDMTGLQLKPGTSWSETYARCVAEAPEAFESDRLLNLFDGRWQRVGRPGYHVTPVDGTPIQGPPQIDRATAAGAVDAARGAARRLVQGRPGRAQGAGDDRSRHDGRPPRPARAAAGLGDRQAVAAGVRGRGPRARRRALVRRGDRPAARARRRGRARAAAGAGLQHRELELPGERAGARGAGAGAGRQRRRREDAHPGRLPLPDARARVHGPRRPADDPALGPGVEAR